MTEITARSDKVIVVMDAQCGLCSAGARWIARRDSHDRFRIVPMQSPLGRTLFETHGINPEDPDTWLLLEGDRVFTGFDAWARTGQVIGGNARVLGLLWLIPRPLRQALYAQMARNRMAIFGRDNLCHLPDPAVAKRLVLT